LNSGGISLATHKSALKRLRQNKKARTKNIYVKSTLRTYTKKLVTASTKEEMSTLLGKVSSLLDKASKRNVITAKTASRRKAKLSRFVNKKIKSDAPAVS
jgi:small subunit ribosomal protein S20